MQKIINVIQPNPFYRDPDTHQKSNLEEDFDLSDVSVPDVKYIYGLLDYPASGWSNYIDIFKYLTPSGLSYLKKNKCIFIFDCTFEGWGKNNLVKFSLEQSAIEHGINPKRIFLFTGNQIETSESINVIPICNLDHSFYKEEIKNPTNREKIFSLCQKEYTDKIFLSLSRRNREHRVLAHLMLYNSPIFQHGLVSQDILQKDFNCSQDVLDKINCSHNDFTTFKDALPFIADENNFEKNDPLNPLKTLHAKTLFSIVNETLADSENNSTLFFSEKFLKPIINLQPMVIYGHKGINKKLSFLGYKTYEDYFDLSFDDEPDDIIRYQKLLESITLTVQELLRMNRNQQLRWRFRHLEILEFNYKTFLARKHPKSQIELFSKKLSEINFEN